MGPGADVLFSSKSITVQKLLDDGSNWISYKEKVQTAIASRGLKQHLLGTAIKPPPIIERNGRYYISGTTLPLTYALIESHQKKIDEYDEKEAQCRYLLYETVSHPVFTEIKRATTSHDV